MIPVANLPKYAMFGDGDMMCVKGPADANDKIQRYVKFEEAMEASSNSLQQLKAEIAAIADSVEDYTTTGADAGTIACIVRDLRQLSAV